MNPSDNQFDFNNDLDLEIDLNDNFVDETTSITQDEPKLSLSIDFDTKNLVSIITNIRDYLFKLQKQPSQYKLEESYSENIFLKAFNICNEEIKQQENSLPLSDLLEFDHSLRLSLKFLTNIMINIINDDFNNNIDLKKIFNIIDKDSISYTNILIFNKFLIDNNGKKFIDAQSFIQAVNFNNDKSIESLISLELSDVIWPFNWDIITIIPIFEKINKITTSIFINMSEIIKIQMMKIAPNLLNLLNSQFDILKKILMVTKSLENLVKMNNKTLAKLGKKTRSDDETKGFLFKNIYELFPILAEHEKQLSEALMHQLKIKTVQRLSSKIILVAKIDFYNSSKDGVKGLDYHMDMVRTIENWIENDQPKLNQMIDNDLKPLAIPKDNNYVDGKNKKGKRRAGTKLTKYRQKFKKTGKLDILQNRIEFGKEETFLGGKDQYMDNMEDSGLGMAVENITKLKNAERRKNKIGQSNNNKKKINKNKGKIQK